MSRPLPRFTATDPAAQSALDQLVTWLNALRAVGWREGVRKTGVALTTSNTAVYHGLGYEPSVVCALKLNANATVYVDTTHADPTNYVNVKASAAVTATLHIE